MSEWRPIGSAPLDGTHVDILDNGKYRKPECYWSRKNECWYSVLSDKDGKRLKLFKPTHWMPIPDLPKEIRVLEPGSTIASGETVLLSPEIIQEIYFDRKDSKDEE